VYNKIDYLVNIIKLSDLCGLCLNCKLMLTERAGSGNEQPKFRLTLAG